MGVLKIGVLGAGIIGTTTALEIQKELPTSSVTIIADKFYNDTTSCVAAGIFRPSTSFNAGNEELESQMVTNSYEYYNSLCISEFGPLAGVVQVSGYIFSTISEDIVKNHFLEKLVPLYRYATADELSLYPGGWKYGSFFTTLLIESRRFLPWALNRFKNSGGLIVERRINTFNDVSPYDIVVNCTGFGAKYLCKDRHLVPIRGQLVKVKAPWIKTFVYGDFETYVVPGFDSVSLGGVREFDNYDTNINMLDSAQIRERVYRMIPSLRKAPVVEECVGLRPHRVPVRVEPEIINTPQKKLKVVHNYGHGGYGVTTAPGSAQTAVKLVKELHGGKSKL